MSSQEEEYPLILSLQDANPSDVLSASGTTSDVAADVTAQCDPLSEQEVQRIYGRMPNIEINSEEQQQGELSFVKRESTLPVPKSQHGKTITRAFPPSETREQEEGHPRLAREKKQLESDMLKVVRFMPEGEVPMAPHLTITFSQPIAPVATLEQLPDPSDWIEIQPPVEGRFRWLGTQTIMFEPEHRFPMATEYHVRVRADRVRCISNRSARLSSDFEFHFFTPTPRVRSLAPNGATMTNKQPVFHVEFDQKIDAEKLLQAIHLTERHKAENSHSLILLSRDDAKQIVESHGKKSSHLKYRYERLWDDQSKKDEVGQDFWFTVQENEELPLDKHFTITVGPHVPSKEGTRTQDTKETFFFRTYAPLCISQRRPLGDTRPLRPWTVEFNNSIDEERFEEMDFENLVQISPTLENVKYNLRGRILSISGRSKGDTTYTVKLSPHIEDQFGQQLHGEKTVQFQVGRARQTFHAFAENLITLDPTEPNYPPSYSVVVCNVDKLKVTINQVQPDQFLESNVWRDPFHSANGENMVDVGTNVFSGEIDTNAARDEPKEVVIDITQYLQHPEEKLGHLLINVQPTTEAWSDTDTVPRARAWIQSTRIAADTFIDGVDNVYCFANSLVDGSPLEGVSFESTSEDEIVKNAKEKTDQSGMTTVKVVKEKSSIIVATQSIDSCIVDRSFYSGNANAQQLVMWYVVSDRGMYKPKEKLRLKGITRIEKMVDQSYYVNTLPPSSTKIRYTMRDARGVVFKEGTTETNEYGAFVIKEELPDTINLGNCHVQLEGPHKSQHSTDFKVQEFRTPEFKVECQVHESTAKPHFIANDSAVVSVKASYYAGGPLPGTSTSYRVTQESSHYCPPGWSTDGWIFQKQDFGWMRRHFNRFIFSRISQLTHTATTNSAGEHQLRIDYKTNERYHPHGPTTITVNTDVQDINRQTLSANTSLLIHPSSLYIGIKPRKRFGKAGTSFVFDVIVTDIRGTVVPNAPFTATLTHHSNAQKGSKVIVKDVHVEEQSLESGNVEKEVAFNLPQDESGQYSVSVSTVDAQGRTNEGALSFWVQGSKQQPGSKSSSLEQQPLSIIADKDQYKPGEEAQLLVQVPFSQERCELLVLAHTHRVVHQSRYTIERDNCTLIRVPIAQEHIPLLNVFVYAVSADQRLDESGRHIVSGNGSVPMQPAYGSARVPLKVVLESKRLNVDVRPEKQQLEPGGETNVVVSVKDHQGRAIPNAEVTLIAIDEAILSLSNYSIEDPLPTFYIQSHFPVSARTNRSTVMVRDWSSVSVPEYPLTPSFGGGGGFQFGSSSRMAMTRGGRKMKMMQSVGVRNRAAPESAVGLSLASAPPPVGNITNTLECLTAEVSTTPIQARSNFDALAAFVGSIATDDNGSAKTTVTLPDNLTRYRMWAIAHTVDQFGLGESHLVASLPMMVRCSLPRFANFGDRIDATVTIQNQTDVDATVKVVARYANLSHIDGSSRGYKLQVPAFDRREIRFSVATNLPGDAKFQCGAELVGKNFADATEVSIPVYTPTTTEAFATYGEIDADEDVNIQAIARPENIFANFGGLQVNTSSTILQSLTDSFIYLWEYPFQCVEQISSRIISVVALQDVLEVFHVEELPSRVAVEAHISKALQRLKLAQKVDGSFGLWDRNSRTHAFTTVHAAFALVQAKIQDHSVDSSIINSVAKWLRNVDKHIANDFPYGHVYKQTIRAYALYTLSLIDRHTHGNMGDRAIVQEAKKLFMEFMTDKRTKSESQVQNLDCLAWISQAIFNCNGQDAGDETIRHVLHTFKNHCHETAETANFAVNYSDDDFQHVLLQSNRRTDGIVLDVLLAVDRKKEQSNLVTKVVKGLLAHKKQNGRWRNTQENVFILLALKRYFHVYESADPDFVCRMWIAEQFAGENKFQGRSVDTQVVNIPMSFLVGRERDVTSDLVLQKIGKPGRLYYRIGLDYAPQDLKQAAMQQGFTVRRTYEHITDERHVTFDDSAQAWKFKLGELVRVRVKIVNTGRRYHVAMVDWMPAGLEALNPDLATTGPIPGEKPPRLFRGWWNMTWYEHTNLRDERVEAFASLLWEGEHEFTYVARATSAGLFVAPPCKVEEMYSPEIFGRSKSEKVTIE